MGVCLFFGYADVVMKLLHNPLSGTARVATHVLALLSVSAFVSTASADVELYAVRKSKNYKQTADAVIDPSYFRFDAQLRTSDPADFAAVSLTGSTGGPVALSQSGKYWSYNSPGYATEAEMDAAHPDHVYQLEGSGGILGGPLSYSVNVPSLYPATIPMLTGNTFSGLNAWNPDTGDFEMTFTSHLDISDITYVMTYVTFYDETLNDGIPISWSLPSTATSLVLDSSLFQSGHEYYGYLQFFHQYSDGRDPHYGAIKSLTTSFAFTTSTDNPGGGETPTVPDTSSSAALALTLVGIVAWHRRTVRR